MDNGIVFIILILIIAVIAYGIYYYVIENPPSGETGEVETEEGENVGEETAGWQLFENEKYGYSFKYPAGCSFGPLEGSCKELAPEERSEDCLCYLNAENLDNVSLGTFTGTKPDLVGASFGVFHSVFVDSYKPPAGSDLVSWIKDNFFYEEIPDKINMEIDGLPALKVYTPASPMAFSQEDIFFIKDDLLFKIGLLNVDNTDNRKLYDQILSSFKIIKGEVQAIELEKGESFFLTLNTNPTTGYEWHITFDTEFIELASRNYTLTGSGWIGAGGRETFKFVAIKEGETRIPFSYLRSWEEGPPIESRIHNIVIR